MHAPPPLLEQLLIIANADDYLILKGLMDGQRGLRIVVPRRRPRRWRSDWLVLVAIAVKRTGNQWLLRGRSVDCEQTSTARTKTEDGAQCLELWQSSEQVMIAAACVPCHAPFLRGRLDPDITTCLRSVRYRIFTHIVLTRHSFLLHRKYTSDLYFSFVFANRARSLMTASKCKRAKYCETTKSYTYV